MKMGGYRRDIEAARRRLAGRERRILRDPRFGDIEYTEWGNGPPMILSHPLFGGFDAEPGLAETYIGAGPRFIAPSRFGYLGSSLLPRATPAVQADAYALLLDSLGIDRVAVFGYSVGGPSAMQFALRHADRTSNLNLMASALPGRAEAPPKVVAKAFAMFLMMRGGHGHTTSHDPGNSPKTDASITELEREVARIRAEAGSSPDEAHSPGPAVADRVAAVPPAAATPTAPEEVHHG